MTESVSPWYSKAMWNGVEIDLPYNHDLSTYGTSKEWREYHPLTDPTAALQSLKFKRVNSDGLPLFTARFKVPYNSISDIAYGFFTFDWNEPVTIEPAQDGVILEAIVHPVCSIEEVTPEGAEYPETCWFERAEAAGEELSSDKEIIHEEHPCEGTIFEYFVAVQKGDLSPIEHFSEDEDWFEGQLDLEDAEVDRAYIEHVDRLTAPDGSKWRVLRIQHED